MSNNLIVMWLGAKADADKATAAEKEIRQTVYETYSDKREKGTETYDANGGKLKIVSKLYYKLPKKEDTDAVLRSIAALKNADGTPRADAGFIANRLVKWVPELSVSEYNKLASDDPIKLMIDRIITTTPASPTVTFEVDEKA